MQNRISFLLALLLMSFAACQMQDPMEPGALVPLTVDEDGSLPAIDINDTRLHLRAFGEATDPMLIFLHGGPGGDHKTFLPYQRLADEGYRVVMFDQRGAGRSRRHVGASFTEQQYLDDLEALIVHFRQSAEQPVILIGHSWGAMYATMFINTFPDQIQGAILMEPGGLTDEQMMDYVSVANRPKLFEEGSNDLVMADRIISPREHALADYRMFVSFSSVYEIDPNATPLPVWRMGAVAARYTQSNTPDFDWTGNLEAFEPRVMLVYGGQSAGYTERHLQNVQSVYRDVEVIEIPESGHDLPFEAEADMLDLIRQYLNETL
ncbi:MAG: alpha/beta hydrolase [Bacteroidota bacterium]